MANKQKAVATGQMESPVSDDRQRMAARLAQCLRDDGYKCEVVAALPIHRNRRDRSQSEPSLRQYILTVPQGQE